MGKSNLTSTSNRPRRIGRLRRQAVSLMLAVVLAVQSLLLSPPDQAGAEPITMTGSGIEGNPYIVTSAGELEQVRNDLSAWYVLDRDITLTGEWTPIGILRW